MCEKDIEKDAVNLDGTPDVEGSVGGEGMAIEAARAKSRFDEATRRNKDAGERDPGRDR